MGRGKGEGVIKEWEGVEITFAGLFNVCTVVF